jgi:4-amino-4-deoxy-L-arabinose transferase-like glycosyltransferase
MLKKIFDRPWLIQLLIVAFASILFMPFIGGMHLFDWDEINFAESAREMLVSHNYMMVQIDFKPFWEKPPLFIWFQVLSMKAFGINEFAARFPNSICGILTLLSLFRHGKKLFDAKFGLLWVLIYASSILPYLYFKSGIIDPWFNLFIFNGIAFFVYYIYALQEKTGKTEQFKNLLYSAAFIGLAVLTKGPVAFLVFSIALAVFVLIIRFKIPINPIHILIYLTTFCLVGGFWFIMQLLSGNGALIADFINYQIRLFTTQDAGHGGFFLYHFVVLLMGVFPASVFALPFIVRHLPSNTLQVLFQRWMIILFWTVLILFTIVKTKIVHYSSLCYFPITFLATLYLYSVEIKAIPQKKWVNILQLTIGGIIAFVALALPFLAMKIQWILDKGWVDDAFAAGNMKAGVSWTGFEALAGLILALGLIYYGLNASKKNAIANRVLLFSSLFCVMLLTLLVTPRIEGYSQRAAIEFCEEAVGKDVYVNAVDYFSYAPLFYAKKQPAENPNARNINWLLSGDIDKDAYFLVKVDRLEENTKKYPSLQILYEKNGFVFLKRKAILHDK